MGGQLICGFMHGEGTYLLMEEKSLNDCLVQKHTQRQKPCHMSCLSQGIMHPELVNGFIEQIQLSELMTIGLP